MDIKDRIKFAENVINGKDLSVFSKLYPFTTENLNGYMSRYNFTDKRILTVGSSCDQILNAHLLGAKEIVCFDINPLTEFNFNLKSAAIKTLEFHEFINFFCLHVGNSFFKNKNAFNEEDFFKINTNLTDESLFFWNYLFSEYSSFDIRKKLYTIDEYNSNVICLLNNYLSYLEYLKIQNTINQLNPTFIVSDLKYVDTLLSGKFDFIFLSNIAAFISYMYDNPLVEFRNNILKLMNFLNDDGVLFLAYLYRMNRNTKVGKNWDLIYHLDKIFEYFKNENIDYETFLSIESIRKNKINVSDMVLTLRK